MQTLEDWGQEVGRSGTHHCKNNKLFSNSQSFILATYPLTTYKNVSFPSPPSSRPLALCLCTKLLVMIFAVLLPHEPSYASFPKEFIFIYIRTSEHSHCKTMSFYLSACVIWHYLTLCFPFCINCRKERDTTSQPRRDFDEKVGVIFHKQSLVVVI